MSLEVVRPHEVNYQHALNFASVYCEAFRNDPAFVNIQPPKFRFNALTELRSITDPRQRLSAIVAKARSYRIQVYGLSWVYYEVLSQPGVHTFFWHEPDLGVVAAAAWQCPPALVPAPSLLTRTRLWLRHINVKAHQLWYYWVHGLTATYDQMAGGSELFSKALDKLNFCHDVQRLKQLSPEQLSVSGYTCETAWDLLMFGAAPSGKGYGYKLFEAALDKIRPYIKPVPFESGTLPPKLSILATPTGERLYSKFNFRIVDNFKTDLPDGMFSISLMTLDC